MDVHQVLTSCGVTDAHLEVLGQGVPEGYAALAELAKNTPMLSAFPQGSRALCYLRDVAVQHALEARAAQSRLFYTSAAWNGGHNHLFLKLQVGQVVFTTHYAGEKGGRGVRKAVARAELAKRTPDLFAADGFRPDHCVEVKSAYAQIVHAGLDTPKFAIIQIPNRDQRSVQRSALALELATPTKGAVEEVQDRLNEAFKVKARDEQAGQSRDVG